MWKNPRLVTDTTARQIAKYLSENPDLVSYQASDKGEEYIDKLFDMQEEVCTAYFVASGQRQVFFDAFHDLMMRAATQIIEANSYYEIELLNTAAWLTVAITKHGPISDVERIGIICSMIVGCITALLGSETQVFVGFKGNIPAFRELGYKMHDPINIVFLVSTFPSMMTQTLACVGQADTWMVPRPMEWSPDLHYKGHDYDEVNKATLKRALENQCYTVHPQGVQVKLKAREITNMWLKVNPKPNSPYVQILARVDSDSSGSFFTVIDEESVLGPDGGALPLTPSFGSYVGALICQVYHDLVTVRTATGSGRGPKKIQEDGLPAIKSSSVIGETTIPWTAIQRTVRNKRITERGPRQETPIPKMKTPHFVCGHPRVGNMTEQQRTRVREFEERTGLQVLDRLPTDKTYVLPHMSPMPESPTDYLSLPRFVRARIHNVLEESMRRAK